MRLFSFSRQYPDFLFPGKTQIDPSQCPFQAPRREILDPLAPRSWRRTAYELASYHPDAILFQWWQPFFALAYWAVIRLYKRSHDAPVLFVCHNVYPHESLPLPGGLLLERFLIKLAFRKVDGFLAYSQELVQQIRHFNLKAPVRKIFHPCYDFYEQWHTNNLDSNVVPRLLFFGNVREYKGLGQLLGALGQVKDKIDFEVVVAGEFYVDVAPYRRMAEELKISDRLVWHAHYIPNEQVPALFTKADLVVVPYLQGTQSGVIPLAYQFNVPVIASDVAGLSEVVLDGKTGYLVPPGESESLGKKIIEFFQGEKKAEFQNHIRRFRQELSWQQVIDNILCLLKTSDDSSHFRSQ